MSERIPEPEQQSDILIKCHQAKSFLSFKFVFMTHFKAENNIPYSNKNIRKNDSIKSKADSKLRGETLL